MSRLGLGVALLLLVLAPAARAAPGAEALEQRAAALRASLRGQGFTVVVEPPFVVIGDEAPARVRSRAVRTVRWSVALLKQDYFERDPGKILEVWLFRDAASYRKHARARFGDEPPSPYGYYSPDAGALIMNIKPGAGTLVHEIVHPYVEENFPEAPAWLNEGLASLYEYPAEKDGHMYGHPNWRLPALQRAIRAGKAPRLAALLATSTDEFYEGEHTYAAARYLCYYLQEKGLLRDFYRRFRAGVAEDPTGWKTLQAVLGRSDMEEFQREWRAFVLRIPY